VDNVLWLDKAEPGKCGQSAFAAGDYDICPPGEDFDALVERLNEPAKYDEDVARILQRKAPWG
jgi:hypothetical protein